MSEVALESKRLSSRGSSLSSAGQTITGIPSKPLETLSATLDVNSTQALPKANNNVNIAASKRNRVKNQNFSRTAPSLSNNNNNQNSFYSNSSASPNPSIQPAQLDYKQSVFMSNDELNYINYLASDHNPKHDQAKKHAFLRSQSQARYKNWGNTLEALREKKKIERLERLHAIELHQQQVDQEEANYQEAQRRVVVNRANRLLYLESERVATLHSGLLLSNVLREREQQIALSKRRQAQKQEIEKAYELEAKLENEKLKKREEEEAETEKEKARRNALTQQQQLAEATERAAIERLSELREGERLRKMAVDALLDAEREEAKRRERMAANNREYLRANEEQERIKKERAKREAEEEEKINKFAAEKERLVQLRKEHENAKFQERQARFNKMIERQQQHLIHLRELENARVHKQAEEVINRNEAALAAELERQKNLLASIQSSRNQQIERKKEANRKRIEMDKKITDEWNKKNLELEEEEKQSESREKENAKLLAQALKVQIRKREMEALANLANAQEEAVALADARRREDSVFEEYAASVIDQAKLKGKSPIPIQLALDKLKHPKM